MKNTIFIKTLAGFIVISLVLVTLITVISFRIIEGYHLETLRGFLDDLNSTLATRIAAYLNDDNYTELDGFVKSTGEEVSYRITVIKTNGIVVADTEEYPANMDNHIGRPEVIISLQHKVGESIRYSTSVASDMLYRAYPLYDDENNLIAILRFSIFSDRIEGLLSSLMLKIRLVGFIVLLFSIIAIYIYIYRLTEPVRELTEAVKKIAGGDFNVKVIPRSKDDIGSLVSTFNDMAARMNRMIMELTYRKNTLDMIISSMREGLFLISRKGIILEANDSFKKLIGNDEIIGKQYWEVVKIPEISEYIRELISTGINLSREFTLKNTYYLGSGMTTQEGELLILLHDITDLKNIERIKKDIVANVSHELRSPLTAIKGFLETLDSEVSDQGKDFLAIITRNVNRLINIVNDLLTLTKLERGVNLELVPVNINNVINNIAKVYRKKVSEKGLSFEVHSDPQLPPVQADEFKLEQLLTNLIENAIQYTDKGSITIATRTEQNRILLEVSDTGCGIATEDLDRIFERFYVVDKSRSRKYGGTGLGLSIVKHITLLHNGSISVESILGRGTVFRVKLPVISAPPHKLSV